MLFMSNTFEGCQIIDGKLQAFGSALAGFGIEHRVTEKHLRAKRYSSRINELLLGDSLIEDRPKFEDFQMKKFR